MSRLTLNKLTIENFKGIKSFVLDTNGGNMEIVAENGVGKTTIKDSFLWLFFGKDSTGRTDFEARPLDRYNEPIKGLVTTVEAEFDLDGEVNTFRKENKEKIVKKQLRGYEAECWINKVPFKVSEYQQKINAIISEDKFRVLTDLTAFNSLWHWTDRRAILLELAGEIEQPEGFDELLKEIDRRNLKGKDKLDDLKAVLSGEKKRYSKEREEINPRIDQVMKCVQQPGDIDVELLEAERDSLEKEIQIEEENRKQVLESEDARQKTINEINRLEVEKRKREVDLMKPDPKKTAELKEQRAKLVTGLRHSEDDLRLIESGEKEIVLSKKAAESSLLIKQRMLAEIRTEYTQVSEKKESTACYACGQKLPENKLKEMAEKKAKRLAEIEKQGNSLKEEIDSIKERIITLEAEIQTKQTELDITEANYKTLEEQTEQQIAAINKQLADVPVVDPKTDETWLKLDSEITQMKEDLGEPAVEQLRAIDEHLNPKKAEFDKLRKVLASSERLKADAEAVRLLKNREKELSQLITDCEKFLEQIQQYKMEQAKAVTEAVNDKFDIVEFKMFNIRLNESIEECCEATLNGVPYKDLSTGQQIIVGLDIINTLSQHYEFSAPLFIDHAESLTYAIKTIAQTILLRAQKGVRELTVS